MAPKEVFSVTDAIVDKMTGTAGDIMEKRYPSESLPKQMLKSPDVMLAGTIALGVLSITILPVEFAVDMGIEVARTLRGSGSEKPSDPEA